MQAIAKFDAVCRTANASSLGLSCSGRGFSTSAGIVEADLAKYQDRPKIGCTALRSTVNRELQEAFAGRKSIRAKGNSRKHAIRADGVPSDSVETATAKVEFKLQRHCYFGQKFFVCGDNPAIGSWNVEEAYKMQWTEGDVWVGEVELPEGVTEFKFILKDMEGGVEWQPGPNRQVAVEAASTILTVQEPWDEEFMPEELPQEEQGSLLSSIATSVVEKVEGALAAVANVSSEISVASDQIAVEGGKGSSVIHSGLDQVAQAGQKAELEEASSIEAAAGEAVKPQVEAEESTAPVRKSTNGAATAASGQTGSTIEGNSNNILAKDAAWGLSAWKNLIQSWGRRSLMDEESQKEGSRH